MKKNKEIKVLIVEDDKNFRNVLVHIITKKGYKVVQAENGRSAMHILGSDYIDVIVSDVKMPDVHGIELLHHVKRNYKIPFIMMTGFNDLIETTEAFELGVSSFLSKPFLGEEIISALESVLGDEDSKISEVLEEPIEVDQLYTKLEISCFSSGSEFKHSIYLKLRDGKYVKIAHEGEDLNSDRLKKFKNKGIYYLYIEREYFKDFVEVKTSVSKAVMKSDKVTTETKSKFLLNVNSTIMKYLFEEDRRDNEVFEIARLNCERTFSLISSTRDVLTILQSFSEGRREVFDHSIAVSILSSAMVRQQGWQSPKLGFLVAVSSLFHDVGKMNMPERLDCLEPIAMTDEDKKLYEQHPDIGADILKELDYFPEEVVQIVRHHHEFCNGSGFPRGIAKGSSHPLSHYICIADKFCKLFNHPDFSNEENKVKKVLIKIEMEKELYGKDIYKVLESLFK